MDIEEMFQTLPCIKCFFKCRAQAIQPTALVDIMLQMNGKPFDLRGSSGASVLYDDTEIVWKIAFYYSSTNFEWVDIFLPAKLKRTNVCNPLLTEDVLKAFPSLKDSVWKGYGRSSFANGDAPAVIITEFQVKGHECNLKRWVDLANVI